MDDLLLYAPMKLSHFDKLEDLLKALHKNGLKISLKKCQLFKTDLSTWAIQFSLETKEYV